MCLAPCTDRKTCNNQKEEVVEKCKRLNKLIDGYPELLTNLFCFTAASLRD